MTRLLGTFFDEFARQNIPSETQELKKREMVANLSRVPA
jgi:hypothetical protein